MRRKYHSRIGFFISSDPGLKTEHEELTIDTIFISIRKECSSVNKNLL